MSHKASSKLVTFLYLLARDYLPTGKIKNAINQSNELVGPELTADEIGTLAERWARELGVATLTYREHSVPYTLDNDPEPVVVDGSTELDRVRNTSKLRANMLEAYEREVAALRDEISTLEAIQAQGRIDNLVELRKAREAQVVHGDDSVIQLTDELGDTVLENEALLIEIKRIAEQFQTERTKNAKCWRIIIDLRAEIATLKASLAKPFDGQAATIAGRPGHWIGFGFPDKMSENEIYHARAVLKEASIVLDERGKTNYDKAIISAGEATPLPAREIPEGTECPSCQEIAPKHRLLCPHKPEPDSEEICGSCDHPLYSDYHSELCIGEPPGGENMAQAKVIDQAFYGTRVSFYCTACEGMFTLEQIKTVRGPDNIHHVFCNSCFASVKPDPVTYVLEKAALELPDGLKVEIQPPERIPKPIGQMVDNTLLKSSEPTCGDPNCKIPECQPEGISDPKQEAEPQGLSGSVDDLPSLTEREKSKVRTLAETYCYDCERPFGSAGIMHIEIHKGVKYYRCMECKPDPKKHAFPQNLG